MSRPDPFAAAIANKVDPQRIDTFSAIGYTPTDRQRIFHDLSQQRIDAIFYGGAAGGGKSCALLQEALYCAVNWPGMHIGCLRKSYPELEESFLGQLHRQWHDAKVLGARYTSTDHILHFPNGSEINFSFAKNAQEAEHFLGGEYQMWCVDEAGQMPEDVLQHIEERLRSSSRDLPVLGLRFASNPGGVSGAYLKDKFVKATNYGVDLITTYITTDPAQPYTVAYIPAKSTDNPHIDRGYKKRLDNIKDKHRRAAMRDGTWDAVPGQFFEEWARYKHVVPKFDIPAEWRRYAGIDWGFRNPWAVCWLAADNDGRLWVYREKYATGVLNVTQAKQILEVEEQANEHEVIRIADPSMWAQRGTPFTIADQYGLAGCGITQGDNDRVNGWSLVRRYMADGPLCEYHKWQREIGEYDEDECPLLHVFDDECPMFCEYIPALMRAEKNWDDAETTGHDHMPDALRYVIMYVGNFAGPVFPDEKDGIRVVQQDIPYVSSEPELENHGLFMVKTDFTLGSDFDIYGA